MSKPDKPGKKGKFKPKPKPKDQAMMDNDMESFDDDSEQPQEEIFNSALVGKRVKLINGHQYSGKIGEITSLILQGGCRYVPKVTFENPIDDIEDCLIYNPKHIQFLDNSVIQEKSQTIESSQNSQGYKLPADDELIESFWEHCGNIEMVAQSYGVRRRTVHLRIQNDESGKLTKELEAARKAAIPFIESATIKCANGYDVWEDKIFNANGVPLIVPTIKHIPASVKAQEFWLSGNDERYRKNKLVSFGDKEKTFEELLKELNARASETVEDADTET